jgi:hypothetical protein
MARDRTPRDAFGRSLDPDADFGLGSAPSDPDGADDGVAHVGRWEERGVATSGVDAANPQATVAFVLGLLGLVAVPYLLSVAAIVIANRADHVADALPGAPGRSAARAGRVLGYVGLGVWLLLPLLFLLLLAAGTTGSV